MSGCCAPDTNNATNRWKRALRIALVLNFSMFVVESIASKTSGSMSLQADALDFLGDSFNYGISLYVINHSLKTRATVSFLKGLTMAGFGVFILVETILKIRNGGLPEPPTMGMVGSLALAVNLGVALILYKFREGDSNMQSVWLCTRNDAIGNVMVLIAAWLVLWTRTGWPDWIAGLTLASLGFASGIRVIRLSRKEIEFNEPSEGNCC